MPPDMTNGVMPVVRAVVQICEASFMDMEECSWSMKSVSYPADLARRGLGNSSEPSRVRVHLEDAQGAYFI